MRAGVSILGGLLLTLLLFALLAQLVVPPRALPELPKEITLAMAEAPAQQESLAPAPTSKAMPEPPALVAATPPPAPATLANSPIVLPEPELPPMKTPEVTLDAKLPELTEVKPEPESIPKPKPEPPPEPRPDPEPAPRANSRPAPSPQSQASAAASASGNASSSNTTASQETASSDAAGSSPRPTKRVPPEYPSSAQRRGIEGYVEMRFTIRADGSVDTGSIQVVAAKPRRMFEQAARQAIAGWEFPQADGPRAATQRLEFQLR